MLNIKDFNLAGKLPHIRSSNPKIVILISVVVFLIVVNVFVVLYGKTKNQEKTRDSVLIDTVSENQYVQFVEDDKTAVNTLNKFLESIKNKNLEEMRLYYSDYKKESDFLSLVNDVKVYGEDIDFGILQINRSSLPKYKFVLTEVTKGIVKEYHMFTLIEESGEWKIVTEEKI